MQIVVHLIYIQCWLFGAHICVCGICMQCACKRESVPFTKAISWLWPNPALPFFFLLSFKGNKIEKRESGDKKRCWVFFPFRRPSVRRCCWDYFSSLLFPLFLFSPFFVDWTFSESLLFWAQQPSGKAQSCHVYSTFFFSFLLVFRVSFRGERKDINGYRVCSTLLLLLQRERRQRKKARPK